jgi:colanic acid biosynthesis glycosyl transferase WcaI
LVLNFYYAPDFSSDVPILQGIVEGLANRGHAIHMVVTAPHRQGGVVWPEYRRRVFHHEEGNGIAIDRTWVYSRPDMTVAERIINYLSYSALAFPLLLRQTRPDVIFVPTPPPNMGVTGMLASLLRGAPYVLNVQDIYPDVAIRAGVLREGRLSACFQRIENAVYRRASRVAVISEGFRQNLLAKGVPDSKVAVLPNFVDIETLVPLPPLTPLRQELDLEDRVVVLYAGSLGHPQGLDRVLEVAGSLRHRKDLFFLFVGEGSKKGELEHLAKEQQLSNVQFLPPRPWSEVPQVLATADISLVPLRKGFGFETVPSKLYSVMASGRPVVASVDPGSDTWSLVETSGCGLCVTPEDSAALAEAIVRLADDRELRQRLGNAGRTHVVEYNSKARIVSRYEALFVEVTEE